MPTFIFDIGKTNIKGVVLDDLGETIWTRSNRNASLNAGDYQSIDVITAWDWLKETLRQAAQEYEIESINISTHGACAVLLDQQGELLFPVMDYEVEQLDVANASYDEVRPAFSETLSPDLPGGLNLGRQIWWLQHTYPKKFSQLHQILLYPQYWVWKLTGKAVAEVTSLGCHTDLWEPKQRRYSTLVKNLAIEHALPSVVENYDCVAQVETGLAVSLGLPETCNVFAGVHDSNASLARYLASSLEEPFAVLSTGTWIIAMTVGSGCDGLCEVRDMLANVDVKGNPVACARYMGGREFEAICEMTGAKPEDPIDQTDIDEIIASGVYAVPPFVSGTGPFRESGRRGKIIGEVKSGKALATLYQALMMDYELSLLDARGPVLLGSTSLKNPLLCQILAQLRPHNDVLMSNDMASTIRGAWCLTRWQQAMPASLSAFDKTVSAEISGLQKYRQQWLALIND